MCGVRYDGFTRTEAQRQHEGGGIFREQFELDRTRIAPCETDRRRNAEPHEALEVAADRADVLEIDALDCGPFQHPERAVHAVNNGHAGLGAARGDAVHMHGIAIA